MHSQNKLQKYNKYMKVQKYKTETYKKFLSGEVARILEKTPDTEGTIAGDVAKVLRNVRMG